ncbi:hypothetical protein [Roseovarius pelagicus]|uniref:hypothetical protein n=1 Tax=Roseovarius pelagicus TaxID=2980108 RepID=UPI0027E41690|nr:hypothetical protein [Roseovarius pelagicus]
MAGYFTERKFNDLNKRFFEALSDFVPVLIIETDEMTKEEVLAKTQDFAAEPSSRVSSIDLLDASLTVASEAYND